MDSVTDRWWSRSVHLLRADLNGEKDSIRDWNEAMMLLEIVRCSFWWDFKLQWSEKSLPQISHLWSFRPARGDIHNWNRSSSSMPTCMRQEMVLQISLLGETFGALSTAKGPCSLMDMRVTSKIARCGECLIAVRTFVRFFLGKPFASLIEGSSNQLTLVCVIRW